MEDGKKLIAIEKEVIGLKEDLTIWMCRWCGMRWAKDAIAQFARGMEQQVFYASIEFCPACSPEKLSARLGIKKRVDLPTSIGSIVEEEAVVNG